MQDPTINQLLKRLWSIHNRLLAKEELTQDDIQFYNENLHVIKTYYTTQAEYWNDQNKI